MPVPSARLVAALVALVISGAYAEASPSAVNASPAECAAELRAMADCWRNSVGRSGIGPENGDIAEYLHHAGSPDSNLELSNGTRVRAEGMQLARDEMARGRTTFRFVYRFRSDTCARLDETALSRLVSP